MKTIYEERYNKALESAKRELESCRTLDCAAARQIFRLFPELKESEDEQHRKWILEYLYDGLRKSDEQFKDHFRAAIAWLEKQGEQKQIEEYVVPDTSIIEAEKKSIAEANNNKFYYIENTVDEHNSDIITYCKTLDDAKERLKVCCDWYRPLGTGRIYEIEFGKSPIGKLIYNKE